MDPEPAGERGTTGPRGGWQILHSPRVALAVGLALLTFAVFPEAPATQIPIYEVGAVATDNVIAPFAYNVPKTDEELRRERDDVARATEPIFRTVPAAFDSSRAQLIGFERSIDAAAGAGAAGGGGAEPPPNVASAIRRAASVYDVALSPDEAAYLAVPARREGLFGTINRVFDRWVAAGVVASRSEERRVGKEC